MALLGGGYMICREQDWCTGEDGGGVGWSSRRPGGEWRGATHLEIGKEEPLEVVAGAPLELVGEREQMV